MVAACVSAPRPKPRKTARADERLFTLVAWRDTPSFTDAERAALALTEAVTRLSDRTDPARRRVV
jgi:alkylhydroperoxidase family enzyme